MVSRNESRDLGAGKTVFESEVGMTKRLRSILLHGPQEVYSPMCVVAV